MKKLSVLKGLLREREINYAVFAKEIGMSASSFSHKLNGKATFTCEEVDRIISKLSIDKCDIPVYFF
ncbi:MAG: DUF739 family protein [Clostridiales bacterium]|nr:DUF739 family protein [Clostridiales bacterium]